MPPEMEVAPPFKLLTLLSLLTIQWHTCLLDWFIKKQILEFPKMPGSVMLHLVR